MEAEELEAQDLRAIAALNKIALNLRLVDNLLESDDV